MKSDVQCFLFYELVSGDILAQVIIKDKGLFPVEELQKESRILSVEYGLKEEDVVWVECYKA
jgi:hypothetical protein